MAQAKDRLAAVLLVATALLAGCSAGSDGDDAGAPGAAGQVPQSAQDSVPGLIAYLQRLIDQTSDTSEPVVLGNAVLPVDDTGQPTDLN